MFLAAALNPEYFKAKVNLYVALAPVASTAHITDDSIVSAANNIDNMVANLVDGRGFFNWFPNLKEGTEAVDAFCAVLGK